MNPQRVLVLGGYGYIGLAITRQLHQAGHEVTALGRSEQTARRVLPADTWLIADIARLTEPSRWLPLLANVDVIVNASGALQSGLRDDLPALQASAIIALVQAAQSAGVQRFIQISAPGAHVEASTEFFRTKALADGFLKESALQWIILRPGLVIGQNAYGGTALLRMLASTPLVLPLVFADQKVQTVALDDVVVIVSEAVAGRLPTRVDLDLVEPAPHTLRAVVEQLRAWLGFPPARLVLELPAWCGRLTAAIADALGALGWRSPLRSTSLQVMSENVIGDPGPLQAITGRPLSTLAQTLQRLPATRAERWSARLYGVLPVMIGILAAFWIATGLITLADVPRAMASVPQASPVDGAVLVVGGAVLDLLLGAAILVRPWARYACIGMIVTTGVYLLAGTWLTPALWSDPLGPFVKTIPAAMLAGVTALLLDDR